MKRLAATVALASVTLLGVAGPALADHHEQADGCDHGATSKPCRPDPQPTRGKDCEVHGNHGGINEDHCAPAPSPTTTRSTPSPTTTSTAPTSQPTQSSHPQPTTTIPSPSQTSSTSTTPPSGPTTSPTGAPSTTASSRPVTMSTSPSAASDKPSTSTGSSPRRSVPSSTGALPRTGFDPRLTGLGAVLLLAGCGSWVARRRGEH